MQYLLIVDGESGDAHVVSVAAGVDLEEAAEAYAEQHSFRLSSCHWQGVHTIHLGGMV